MAPILLHEANCWPNAVSTYPPCTQLTPSSAERARRERRHPKVSTPGRGSRLDPLENTIGGLRRFLSASCAPAIPPEPEGASPPSGQGRTDNGKALRVQPVMPRLATSVGAARPRRARGSRLGAS